MLFYIFHTVRNQLADQTRASGLGLNSVLENVIYILWFSKVGYKIERVNYIIINYNRMHMYEHLIDSRRSTYAGVYRYILYKFRDTPTSLSIQIFILTRLSYI